MNTTEQRAPELHWPAGYPRTPAEERESYPGDISLTRKEAFESIVDELERWGATDVRISTASTHYKDRRTSRTNTTSPPASAPPSASDARTVRHRGLRDRVRPLGDPVGERTGDQSVRVAETPRRAVWRHDCRLGVRDRPVAARR